MARRAEQQILFATRSQAVAETAAAAFSTPTVAVMAGASGSLVGTLSGDTSPTTFTVVQGTLYPLSFSSIYTTSAVAVVALFNTP